MENTEHVAHFKEILSPIFPLTLKCEISLKGEHEEIIQVSWPMPEPERRSKRSRPIHIVFSSEVLSDYDGLGPISRKKFDSSLTVHIQHKFKDFDPTHDTPITSQPIPVKWVVPLVLFG